MRDPKEELSLKQLRALCDPKHWDLHELTDFYSEPVVKKNRSLTMSDDEFKLWFAAHARKDPNSLARDEFVQAAREMEANMDELLNRHGGR